MCGIFGGSGELNPRVLTALGCLNEKRGEDSAGIGWALEDGTPTLAKIAQHPLVAFPKTLQASMVKAAKSGVAIGHTRAATHGNIINKNAHPFIVDGIAWVHNGIISNHEKFGVYEVDSESLIHGIKERSFKKYEGAIAMLWIEFGQVHSFRKGNPLWRGRIGHGLYFASEANMLQKVGCTKIKELAEGTHYTFHGNQIKKVERIPSNKPWTWETTKPYRQIGYETSVPGQRFPGRVNNMALAKDSEMSIWTAQGWRRVALDQDGNVRDVVDEMEGNRSSVDRDMYDGRYGCDQ